MMLVNIMRNNGIMAPLAIEAIVAITIKITSILDTDRYFFKVLNSYLLIKLGVRFYPIFLAQRTLPQQIVLLTLLVKTERAVSFNLAIFVLFFKRLAFKMLFDTLNNRFLKEKLYNLMLRYGLDSYNFLVLKKGRKGIFGTLWFAQNCVLNTLRVQYGTVRWKIRIITDYLLY